MTREEALLLQQESRNYRRQGNWAYDDAKSCDTFEFSEKDFYFERAKKFWILSDEINSKLKMAGFHDLVDKADDDE